MANIKTVFLSSVGSGHDSELQCYRNFNNEIFISVLHNGDEEPSERFVALDISTAIKLAKTLRTEINKAKEVGDE